MCDDTTRFFKHRFIILFLLIIYIYVMHTLAASGVCSCTDSPSVIKDNDRESNQNVLWNASCQIIPIEKLAQRSDYNRSNNATTLNSANRHTIMRPTEDEAHAWIGEYESAPSAYLSPQVKAALALITGAHFSLLDYIQYTPSERDQGICGNCWVWAGTGIMEIDRAFQTDVKDRLSIQYLNSNFNGGNGNRWGCCGGWLADLAYFYGSKKMSVPWSNTNAQWHDGSISCEAKSTSVSASSISTDPHYDLNSIKAVSIPTQRVGKDAAIANIKNVLAQGKAVWFGFFLPNNDAWNEFFSFWDNAQESTVWQPSLSCGSAYNYDAGGGHAVLCVGYDDTDPKNRYWIMLNSWGAPANRPNGLFRMNMDMNYDCSYPGLGNAFYWMTLDINYINSPPINPSIPLGTNSGIKNKVYKYSAVTTDPDGDQLKYTFDWGDGTSSVTTLFRSGLRATASHKWSKAGIYKVKVNAIDSKDAPSGWSNSRTVRIR